MVTKRMNLEDLERIDSRNMFRVYDIWPEIAKKSYEQEFSKPEFKDIDHVVFSGMGGSGTIGDVFSSILSKNDIHTSVVKGYLLPKTVDKNTLVVVISVSGNTQESLTVLKNSKNSQAKFIAFSSGGMIKEYALKNKINYQEIKMEHSPRASFPKYIFSILNTLESIIPVKKSEVVDVIQDNQCGIRVPPGDENQLTHIIQDLHNDPVKLQDMKRNARDCFEKYFTMSKAIQSYEKILSNAMK